MKSLFGATRFVVVTALVTALVTSAVGTATPAAADNARLNRSVVANIYTIQKQAGCPTEIRVEPKLRLAAQWHALDVLGNRQLDADIGSDGSSTQDRARNAGYSGTVSETVAINPALAISGLELIRMWYYRPDYFAIMSNCANNDIGVWSENSVDRTVVVAVYGTGDGAAVDG